MDLEQELRQIGIKINHTHRKEGYMDNIKKRIYHRTDLDEETKKYFAREINKYIRRIQKG